MTSSIRLGLNEKLYACADTTCEVQVPTASFERDLFTWQIGQALITLGKIFVSVHPFNDHIDQKTGELLISLGNKLKARK
jgi:hypothetical protein